MVQNKHTSLRQKFLWTIFITLMFSYDMPVRVDHKNEIISENLYLHH